MIAWRRLAVGTIRERGEHRTECGGAPAPYDGGIRHRAVAACRRTDKKGYIHGFSTVRWTFTPVHTRFTQIRAGFADGFAGDSLRFAQIRERFADGFTKDSRMFATDSQDSRWIRKIRNGVTPTTQSQPV